MGKEFFKRSDKKDAPISKTFEQLSQEMSQILTKKFGHHKDYSTIDNTPALTREEEPPCTPLHRF